MLAWFALPLKGRNIITKPPTANPYTAPLPVQLLPSANCPDQKMELCPEIAFLLPD